MVCSFHANIIIQAKTHSVNHPLMTRPMCKCVVTHSDPSMPASRAIRLESSLDSIINETQEAVILCQILI